MARVTLVAGDYDRDPLGDGFDPSSCRPSSTAIPPRGTASYPEAAAALTFGPAGDTGVRRG